MGNQRKVYEKSFGKVEEGYEIHHVVLVHSGGEDDIGNLVALTKEEHRAAHLRLFKESGNFRDLAAYHMIGYNFSEAHRITSSAGGKVGGRVTKERGNGIFYASNEDKKAWASLGGSASQKTLKERQAGPFYDPALRMASSRKGGLASGSFKDVEAQRRRGKKGGVKNAGSVWVNDGTKTFKFRPSENLSLEVFLIQNPNIKIGRSIHKDKK